MVNNPVRTNPGPRGGTSSSPNTFRMMNAGEASLGAISRERRLLLHARRAFATVEVRASFHLMGRLVTPPLPQRCGLAADRCVPWGERGMCPIRAEAELASIKG